MSQPDAVVPIAEVDHWLDLEPGLAEHLVKVAQIVGKAQMAAFDPKRVGLIVAGLAGFVGGRLDAFIMRVCDVMLSFPAILVALLVHGARAADEGIPAHRAKQIFDAAPAKASVTPTKTT